MARQSKRIKTLDKTVHYVDPEASGEDEPSSGSDVAPEKGTGSRVNASKSTEYVGAVEESSSEEELIPIPGAKRKRGKTKSTPSSSGAKDQVPRPKRRGKRGMLERLVELPLDLLFEVFGKLEPGDVLTLARTSKNLRAVLMHRSAAPIWREAISNAQGLPPCPEDLHEPQWAELAFGKGCQICNRPVIHLNIAWMDRVRGCRDCMIKRYSTYDFLEGYYHISHELWALIPRCEITTGPARARGYWLNTEMFNECRRKASGSPGWAADKIQELKPKFEHSEKCEAWDKARAAARTSNMAELRESRKEQILSRLNALGYSVDIDSFRKSNEFWKEVPFNNLLKRDITERGWQKAQPEAVAVANRIRAQRIEKETRAVVREQYEQLVKFRDDYVKRQSINTPVIPLGDLFLTDEVSNLFANPLAGQKLDASNFHGILEKLPAMTETWQARVRTKLFDVMQGSLEELLGAGDYDESALDLAFAVFSCQQCYSQSTFDHVEMLHHQCMTRGRTFEVPESAPNLRRFIAYHSNGLPWDYQGTPERKSRCTFKLEAAKNIVTALKAFGFDPKTTTASELDKHALIFECKAQVCSSITQGRLMFDWRGAFRHACPGPNAAVPFQNMVKVDEQTAEAVRVRMMENSAHELSQSLFWRRYANPDPPLGCVRCGLRGDGAALRKHLAEKHEICEPTNDDVEMRWAVAVKMKEEGFRWWQLNANGPITFF